LFDKYCSEHCGEIIAPGKYEYRIRKIKRFAYENGRQHKRSDLEAQKVWLVVVSLMRNEVVF
jgi:hypothetical protein